MELWDRFFASGKISDYIKYAATKRGEKNADTERTDTEGKKDR